MAVSTRRGGQKRLRSGGGGEMSFGKMEATLESRNDIYARAEVVTETLALLWRLQILSFAHRPEGGSD